MSTSLEGPVLAVLDDQAINIATERQMIERLVARAKKGLGFTLFTLNLDHLVKRRADKTFRDVYARATFVTADGAPVVALTKSACPEMVRTSGADLIDPICAAAAQNNLPVFFFGATQSSLDSAAKALVAKFPGLDIRGTEAPPFGFDPYGQPALEAGQRIADSGARLCFVALGAPKQEFLSDRLAQIHEGVGFICIGAALDFISGEQVRAPQFMQKIGMGWLWRLMSNPRRLGARYWQCAVLLADIAVLEPLRKRLTGA